MKQRLPASEVISSQSSGVSCKGERAAIARGRTSIPESDRPSTRVAGSESHRGAGSLERSRTVLVQAIVEQAIAHSFVDGFRLAMLIGAGLAIAVR